MSGGPVQTEEDTAVAFTVGGGDPDGEPVTITVGSPAHGVILGVPPDLTYVPAPDFFGDDYVRVVVSDGLQNAETTRHIIVTPVNDPPVMDSHEASTAEDSPVELAVATLLESASDADGDALSILSVGNAAHGTVSLSGGTIRFVPAANYSGEASFEYVASDGTAQTNGRVTILVAGNNDAPVAVDDAAEATEDTPVAIPAAALLANDHDPESTPTLTAVGTPTHGLVSLDGGVVTFTPAADFHGEASFQYTISDGALSATATVTVAVASINDPPVAAGDSAATDEDIPAVLAVAALLANDSDLDGTLTVIGVGQATHGSVSLAAGLVTFVPAPDYNGSASFEYTVSDGELESTTVVSLAVAPINDAPVAVDDSGSGDEDSPVVLSAAALLANDSDVDGTPTVIGVSGASHGSVGLAGTTVTFTPTPGYSGPASFDYTISDGTLPATATVSLSIGAVDDPPVANDDSASGTEDEDVVLAAAALLANDADSDSTMTITSVGGATHGSVSLTGATITFAPDADYSGAASFQYTLTADGQTATATVSLSIDAVDDAPVASDDSASGDEDEDLVLAAAALLANDADIDSTMTITSVDGATHGSVSLSGTTITFTPDADYSGAAAFQYTLTADGQTATATVALTIAAVNDAPVAGDDSALGDEDEDVVIPVGALLANDTDVDGSPSVVSVGDASNGVATLDAGMVTFTPRDEFSGEASFQYTISDGSLEASATVTVTIAAVDDAPVADDQSVSSIEGAPVAITLTATDIDSPTLTYTIATPPAHGALTGTPPEVTYTPDVGYAGEDSFVFQAQGETASDQATVTITVTAAPPPPDLCGNGDLDSGEVCDDDNTDAGDGCRADCKGIEECGDGLVDALAGETCDDGGTAIGDGCDDMCQLDPFVTVPPTQVSVALGCTTLQSNTGRKISSDELGNFYVVMSCGGEGYVVTSTDRGATWSTPASLGITGVSEIAVEGGAAGTAYVSSVANGDLVFTKTADSGATWTAPSIVEAGVYDSEISMDSFESSVYLLASSSGELHLWSNHAGGVGSFTLTALTQSNVFHDVIVDGISGAVFACSDTPSFHVRKSTNGGASFGDEMNPGGLAFFSDWAGSNGFIYVVGTSNDTNIEVIPVGDPASSTPVEGLPGTNTSSSRSIDADAIGNAYVASQLDDGSIQIDRMVFGATSILSADARNVDAAGAMPGIAALPTNDGALYVFTKNGNEIWVGVTVY